MTRGFNRGFSVVIRAGRLARLTVSLLAVLLGAGFAYAQNKPGTAPFEPVVGQAGKDVIWVPTPPMLVERMLRMVRLTAQDTLVDLGSGDGRIAIAGARDFGARSYGLEYNPDMVALSRREAAAAGVPDKATFQEADIYKADFSHATVLSMYLLPNINLDMRPIILRMRPGTRVVSHQFNMGDWPPDDISDFSGRTAYLWIVPAKVEGTWVIDPPMARDTKGQTAPFIVTLKQEYQRISGHANPGNTTLGLRDATLSGDRIRFSFVDDQSRLHEFSGVVSGDGYSGEVRTNGGSPARFSAKRNPG